MPLPHPCRVAQMTARRGSLFKIDAASLRWLHSAGMDGARLHPLAFRHKHNDGRAQGGAGSVHKPVKRVTHARRHEQLMDFVSTTIAAGAQHSNEESKAQRKAETQCICQQRTQYGVFAEMGSGIHQVRVRAHPTLLKRHECLVYAREDPHVRRKVRTGAGRHEEDQARPSEHGKPAQHNPTARFSMGIRHFGHALSSFMPSASSQSCMIASVRAFDEMPTPATPQRTCKLTARAGVRIRFPVARFAPASQPHLAPTTLWHARNVAVSMVGLARGL